MTAVLQVRALLALRWQMVRTPGVKLCAVVAVAALAWLTSLVLGSAPALEPAALQTAVQLAPEAFLGFGVLALVSPLMAGGGAEVVPPDQLVAYPVRPSTQFLGGLVLAPVNLVWVLQLLALSAMTAFLTVGGRLLPGLLTSASYVVALTVVGQALAWTVVGLRQGRAGRWLVAAAGAGLLVTVVLVVRTGQGPAVLDASPTDQVVRAVVDGGLGGGSRWAATTGLLVATAVLAWLAGSRACAWALRRPSDRGTGLDTPLRRRPARRSALLELVAVDRASAWRAPALRRGGLVLAFLPGLLAAGAQVPWASLVVLPGLVGAGAGLLFGINAFCLDGSGAVWLASLPHDPRTASLAKLVVLLETVLGTVVLAVGVGALRAPAPTAAELTGVLTSILCCTAAVAASGLSLSVRHPQRADLAGPRDAVASPGALVVSSIQIALPAALVGVLLQGASATGAWWAAPLVGAPLLAGAVLWLRHSLAASARPAVRARIVRAVAAG